MSVFLQPIFTQTVGAGGVGAITFSNIPQGFTDLLIVCSARSTNSSFDNLMFRFNGDTTVSKYSTTSLVGNGSGASFPERVLDFYTLSYAAGSLPNASSTANTFGSLTAYIPSYSNGNFKQVIIDNANENNTTAGFVRNTLSASCYRSTAPITSLSIFAFSNLAEGSSFTIYGLSSVYDTGAPTAPTIGTVTDLGGIASVAFTANDSGQGRTADNYSVFDQTIMSAPVYAQNSPVIVPVTTGVTYNNLAVSANNAIGSNTSANPAGFTSFNNYAAIASLTLPSAGVLTLSNIPQYYRHLQVRIVARGNGAGAATGNFTLSGNSSGVYGWGYHSMRGNGSSVSAFNGGGAGYQSLQLPVFPSTSQTTNNFGICVIDILDYTDTAKFKTVRMFGGYDDNGSGVTEIAGGYLGSFEPVTSIIFAWANSPFTYATNTTMSIYGIS